MGSLGIPIELFLFPDIVSKTKNTICTISSHKKKKTKKMKQLGGTLIQFSIPTSRRQLKFCQFLFKIINLTDEKFK